MLIMIEKIRRDFGNKAFRGIFWVTIISLAGVSALPVLFKSFIGKDQSIMVVNKLLVGPQEFRYKVSAQEHRLAAYRQQFGDRTDDLLKMAGLSGKPQEMALDQLIDEKILLSIADKLRINLSAEYIVNKLKDPQALYGILGDLVPVYLIEETGTLNFDKLRLYLQRQGLSVKTFEDMLEQTLKEFIVMSLIKEAFVATSAAKREYVIRHFSPRTFSLVSIALEPFIKEEEKKPISDQDLEAFFTRKQNAGLYRTPEKRSGIVWEFDLKGAEGSGKKGDLEIDKARKQFTQDIESRLKADKGSLEAYANEKKAKKVTLTNVTAHNDDATLAHLFGVALPGDRTYYVKNAKAYVVELVNIDSGVLLKIEAIKDTVLRDLYKDRARIALEHALQSDDKKYTKTTFAWSPDKENKGLDVLKQYKFDLNKVTRLVVRGQSLVSFSDSTGYKLTLEEVENPKEDVYLKNKKAIIESVTQDSLSRFIADILASLRKNATITINTSLLTHQA